MHFENMIHGNNMSIQDFGNQKEEEDLFSPRRNISFVVYFCTQKKTWLEILFSSISIYSIHVAFELIFIVVTQAPHQSIEVCN